MKCENCGESVIFDGITFENVCSNCGISHPAESLPILENDGTGVENEHHDMYIENQKLSIPQNRYPKRKTVIGDNNNNLEMRMNMIDRNTISDDTRPIAKINFYVNLLSERLGISHCKSLKERAMDIYERFRAKSEKPKLFSSKVMSAVCLYLAIKEFNIPKTFRDVQSAMKAEKLSGGKNINTFFKTQFLVQNTLSLNPPKKEVLPLALVSSISKQIGLSVQIEKMAMQILEELKGEEFMRKHSPHDLAAASLYYVYFHVIQQGKRGTRHNNKKYIRQDVFAIHSKGNLITLRTVVKAIAESYQKKTESKEDERQEQILVSVPQLSMSRQSEWN